MRVIFSNSAELELELIGDYIAEASPARALAFIREIRNKCNELSEMPRRYPLLKRYAGLGLRRRVHKDYLIIYRIGDHSVEITHILHGAMNYWALLDSQP